MRLAQQFYHLVAEYRERFFTHLERYLLYVYYTSQLDNDDDKEVDQLELDWITWQRLYAEQSNAM